MSLISVKNLTFFHEGSYVPVFDNVSFNIDTDWKLGFVGRNGRGKTTFLNLLLGKYEYEGKISSAVKFTYFPFDVPDKSKLCYEILYGLCPDAEDWQIIRELGYLRVDAQALYRPYGSLSCGEQTKMLLAGLFLNEGGYLLIDEPTNHLDTEARQTVAKYLSGKKSFILVSHDRDFLDVCVDHILSINKTNIEVQSGNFSAWFTEFNRRQACEAAQNERIQSDIRRLEQAARQAADWANRAEAAKHERNSGLRPDTGYAGRKSAKMMKRALVTEARRQNAVAQASELMLNTETADKLKLFPQVYRAERLIELRNVQIKYDGRAVCNPVSFEINRGDRVVLCGKNGCGKSSILKLIVGKNIDYAGSFNIGSGLTVSYVPQDFTDYRGSLTDYAELQNIDESLFKAILHKMDFNKDDFSTDVGAMSQGQKRKVIIAASLCQRAHLYVWDEPLNYIDIYSRLQIENLIREYNPTMILVEHDKAFQNAVATKIVGIGESNS